MLRKSSVLRLLAVGLVLCGIAATPAVSDATIINWELNSVVVKWDWDGVWDNYDNWVYAMGAVFDMYDWAYLFAWYALGWNYLSTLSWSSLPSHNKVELYFYNSNDGNLGYHSSGKVYINTYGRTTLNYTINADGSTTGLFEDNDYVAVLQCGATTAHELVHAIMWWYWDGTNRVDVAGKSYAGGAGTGWLTEALAWNLGECLWPWYYYDRATNTYSAHYTQSEIRSQLRYWNQQFATQMGYSGSYYLISFQDVHWYYQNASTTL